MKWSVDEGCEAKELCRRGWWKKQVADYLNDKYHAGQTVRTFWGVKNHLTLLARSEEELAESRRRSEVLKSMNQEIATRKQVSLLLDERDRREASPYRSFTHAFFGDPHLGYSALDKHV